MAEIRRNLEAQMFAKLTDEHIQHMLSGVKQTTIVDRIMRGMSNTDDKGLMLTLFAVECFVNHCRVSPESAAIVKIQKVDRGSNKTFST